MHAGAWGGVAEAGSDSQALELQVAVSCRVDAGSSARAASDLGTVSAVPALLKVSAWTWSSPTRLD